MKNNLKIEVLVSNIPEDGSIASQFPSQEYVDQQLAKKANLSPEGRLDPAQAPDYTEIPGLYEHIEDTKDEIGSSIADSLQDAKGYTNQQLSEGLRTKADLVNGKIPFDQIPFSADIEDQIQINVENITAVVDQKVAQVVEQVNGVATAAHSYTDTKVAENKTYVDTTIGNVIEDVERLGVSKAVTIPTYLTPEAGVAVGTGVAAGAYYNVRSSSDESYVDEYQNENGNAVATGKIYLSALGVQLQEKAASTVKDASGKSQQEVNDKSIAYFGKTVTPEMFKAPFELDDTNSCIQAWQWANVNKGMVKLGAKIYEVNSALPTITNPCAIVGAGERLTFIKYGVSAVGPCISTQDISFHGSGSTFLDPNSNTIDIGNEKSGVILDGFSIVGDRTSANAQSGIIHYGLTDNLIIGTVGVHNIKGVGWGFAYIANPSNATGIRECNLGHIVVRRCGDQANDIPAIDFFTTGFETSNAVTIERLDSIWPDGCPIRFKNTSTRNTPGRFIRILSGMIHGRENTTGNPQTKPGIEVSGLWYGCQFGFNEINGIRDNQWAIHVHKGDMTSGARSCSFNAAIGTINGVWVESGRDLDFDLSTLNATGTHLKIGSAVLGNVFMSATAKDIQYADWVIDDPNNKLIFKDRGGPFYVSRSSTKKSSAGGLMPSGEDGLKLALLNNGGSVMASPLEVLRYASKTASGVDIEMALPYLPNGLVFSERVNKNDIPYQLYCEPRAGLNCLVFQRTTYTSRKALAWNTAMPTVDTWNIGDIVYHSAPQVLGTTGSKYVLHGWQRITSGSSNILNVDWVEMRCLTGT